MQFENSSKLAFSSTEVDLDGQSPCLFSAINLNLCGQSSLSLSLVFHYYHLTSDFTLRANLDLDLDLV